MKSRAIIDRLVASALVFLVIMAITLFALLPFGETLFADEKIANIIIFGIPACVALLHFFYVPNVGSGSNTSLSGAITSVTTNKPSLSFIITVIALFFLLTVYLLGPVLFNLFN